MELPKIVPSEENIVAEIEDVEEEEEEVEEEAADRITISRAGFGISLVIIILLFITCIVFVAVLIALYLKFVKGSRDSLSCLKN